MTADSHPFTWLTSNYLHQSLDHLVGNVVAYFWCMALYSALALTLLALSFDHNSVVKLSLAAHVAALVVAPLVSASIWQETVQFYAPQHASSPVSGFSTSVSAYIGINAALWAIATAEVSAVKWRFVYLLFQLLLLLLTPVFRYFPQSIQWTAKAFHLVPLASVVFAIFIAFRKPKNALRTLINRLRERLNIYEKLIPLIPYLLLTISSLFLFYPISTYYLLDLAYPFNTNGINLLARLTGMILGYFAPTFYLYSPILLEILERVLCVAVTVIATVVMPIYMILKTLRECLAELLMLAILMAGIAMFRYGGPEAIKIFISLNRKQLEAVFGEPFLKFLTIIYMILRYMVVFIAIGAMYPIALLILDDFKKDRRSKGSWKSILGLSVIEFFELVVIFLNLGIFKITQSIFGLPGIGWSFLITFSVTLLNLEILDAWDAVCATREKDITNPKLLDY
jgi:hypothetical protein